jgi:hypothetical protein
MFERCTTFVPRRGLATLELVLCLPLLAVLLVLILAAGQGMVARCEQAARARYEAWSGRLDQPSGSDLAESASGRLGIVVDGDPAQGLREARPSRPIGLNLGLSWASLAVSAHHAMLAGTWDHRVIQLRQTPPLVPHTKALVYAGQAPGTLDSLATALLGGGGAPAAIARGSSAQFAAVDGALQRAGEALDGVPTIVDSLNRDIENLGRQIDDLNDRIAETDDASLRVVLRRERDDKRADQLKKEQQVRIIQEQSAKASAALGQLKGMKGDD